MGRNDAPPIGCGDGVRPRIAAGARGDAAWASRCAAAAAATAGWSFGSGNGSLGYGLYASSELYTERGDACLPPAAAGLAGAGIPAGAVAPPLAGERPADAAVGASNDIRDCGDAERARLGLHRRRRHARPTTPPAMRCSAGTR